MFASTFQHGENGVEIFAPSGTDPLRFMLLKNEDSIQKTYDRTIKGNCLILEQSSVSSSITCPKSSSKSLGILQAWFCLQLNIPKGKNFSLECSVTDQDGRHRRFHFSTNFKSWDANELHARIAWPRGVHEDEWVTYMINLDDFCHDCFRSHFQSLDHFTLFSSCKVRKIFSLPSRMSDLIVPAVLDFPVGVSTDVFIIAVPVKADKNAPPGKGGAGSNSASSKKGGPSGKGATGTVGGDFGIAGIKKELTIAGKRMTTIQTHPHATAASKTSSTTANVSTRPSGQHSNQHGDPPLSTVHELPPRALDAQNNRYFSDDLVEDDHDEDKQLATESGRAYSSKNDDIEVSAQRQTFSVRMKDREENEDRFRHHNEVDLAHIAPRRKHLQSAPNPVTDLLSSNNSGSSLTAVQQYVAARSQPRQASPSAVSSSSPSSSLHREHQRQPSFSPHNREHRVPSASSRDAHEDLYWERKETGSCEDDAAEGAGDDERVHHLRSSDNHRRSGTQRLDAVEESRYAQSIHASGVDVYKASTVTEESEDTKQSTGTSVARLSTRSRHYDDDDMPHDHSGKDHFDSDIYAWRVPLEPQETAPSTQRCLIEEEEKDQKSWTSVSHPEDEVIHGDESFHHATINDLAVHENDRENVHTRSHETELHAAVALSSDDRDDEEVATAAVVHVDPEVASSIFQWQQAIMSLAQQQYPASEGGEGSSYAAVVEEVLQEVQGLCSSLTILESAYWLDFGQEEYAAEIGYFRFPATS